MSVLPPELQSVLDSLRHRIRRYVLIQGIAAVIVILCGLFWISMGLDVAHFQLRKLELPGWFRMACLILMVAAIVVGVASWVVARYFRAFRARALALVLERRFKGLDDRLITAVELSEDQTSEGDAGLGGAMRERTVRDAAEHARGLDLGQVFDPSPLRRWLIGAVVLLLSVGLFGVMNADAMTRWVNAYLLQRADYWEPYRRSAMEVHVVAPPGEQIRHFDENGVYKHPRGADLTIVATVPESKEIPEQVQLEFRTYGGNDRERGKLTMSARSEREFRHTIGRAIDNHELWVIGGDFVNREPYRVEIVDPPRLDRIVLECDYPDYTGMADFSQGGVESEGQVPVLGTQISLPMETKFTLRGEANKPLTSLLVRTPQLELRISRNPGEEPARLTVRSDETAEPRTVELAKSAQTDFFSADGLQFRLPLAMSSSSSEELDQLSDETDWPLPLPADTQLQFFLEDEDQIFSVDPVLLTVNGIVDGEPIVETRLRGVGNVITRLANIPVQGTIRDDYGLQSVEFGYRIDGGEFERSPIEPAPQNALDYRLHQPNGNELAYFDVVSLELNIDQTLGLTVFATDGDNVNGPHESHGEVFQFTIVTPEDLMATLYDRELNLRLRFEQIRKEVEQVHEDLILHRERYEEGLALESPNPPIEEEGERLERLRQIRVSVLGSADRNLHQVRKNHTETQAVAIGIADIREEMVNNRVDTSTNLQRLDLGILEPLAEINNSDFPQVDQSIGLFRRSLDNQSDPREHIDDALQALDVMLARMDRILVEMRRRETYNELVKALQEIRERQRQIEEATRREQERRLFDLLN